MRKLALFILLLAFPAFAQVSPAPSSTGSINASGTTCATTNACVTLPMYATVSGVSVTVSGTFSATLQPEQSGDGINWSSTGLSTISAVGTTSYTTTAMVGFRIRASAYVSGTAVVTITAGSTYPTQSVTTVTGGQTTGPNANVIYIAQSCSGQTNCYSTPANTQQDNAATTSNTTHNVTISHGSFCDGGNTPCAAGQTTSVGMTIMVTNFCRTDVSASSPVLPAGTITSVTSATQAVASTTATATLAGTGCATWGNSDEAAFVSAVDTAAQATTLTSCPSIILSAGNFLIRTAHLAGQPPICARLPSVAGSSNLGGFGLGFGGSGQGATHIFFIPSAGTFNTPILGYSGIVGLWLHDFTLDCAGDLTAAWATSNNILGLVHMPAYSKTNQVMLGPCAAANNHTIGVAFDNPSHASYLTADSFGGTAIQNSVAAAGIYVDHSAFQDSLASYNSETTGYAASQVVITGTSQWWSIGANSYAAASGTTCIVCQLGPGSIIALGLGDSLFDNGDTSTVVHVAQIGATGALLRMNGVSAYHTSAAAASNSLVLMANAFINNSSLSGPSSGTSAPVVTVAAGGSFFDGCGVFLSAAGGTEPLLTNSGGVVTQGCSIGLTIPATGNFSITNGTFTSITGANQNHLTLNVSSSANAVLTVAYTFPQAYWVAPGSCRAQQVGGNNPQLTFQTTVTQTTTAVTFASTAAATSGDTLQIAIDCQ